MLGNALWEIAMLTIYLVIVTILYISSLLITKYLDDVVNLEDMFVDLLASFTILPAAVLIAFGLYLIYQDNKHKRIW